MRNSKIEKMPARIFEEAKQIMADGKIFWMARRLSKILEYAEFRNFLPVIEKSKVACENNGQDIPDHFVEMHEMVPIGSGAERKLQSYGLSRYACHLIVLNIDRAKPVLATAQAYFTSSERPLSGQDNAGLVSLEINEVSRKIYTIRNTQIMLDEENHYE